MGNRRCTARARGRHARLAAAILALGLVAGCSSGPSQEELDLLEQQRQATGAAEDQVASKKAQKARLERKLADKKAELAALDEKKAAAEANLASLAE